MNKQQRKALYDYLSSTGYVFNKERHKRLKQLLQGKSEESEPVLFDDNDPSIIGPDEEDGEE